MKTKAIMTNIFWTLVLFKLNLGSFVSASPLIIFDHDSLWSIHHQSLSGIHRHLQATAEEVEDYTVSQESMQQICRSMEDQFAQSISCDCIGALKSRTMSVTCEWQEQICGPLQQACGRPVLAMTLVNAEIFSTSTCLYDYRSGGQILSDTCISVDLCDSSDTQQGFCGCDAMYGTKRCGKCDVCNEGTGINMDCTRTDEEEETSPFAPKSSSSCQRVDADLDLAGGAGQILGFKPNFDKFCESLSIGITKQDRVECACDNRGLGNFDISCWTTGENVKTTTNLEIKDGAMNNVRTCSTNESGGIPHCTTVHLMRDTKIESCQESFDGQTCQSCEVCNDGKGIIADCTNIGKGFDSTSCRPATMERVFEVLPPELQPPTQVGFGEQTNSSGGYALRGKFSRLLLPLSAVVCFSMF